MLDSQKYKDNWKMKEKTVITFPFSGSNPPSTPGKVKDGND